jgi:hypothetical protein
MNPRWKHRPDGSTWGDFGSDDLCWRLATVGKRKFNFVRCLDDVVVG